MIIVHIDTSICHAECDLTYIIVNIILNGNTHIINFHLKNNN